MENRPTFLMCRPDHFAVSYVINPWMDPQNWTRDRRARTAAAREWQGLHDALIGVGGRVELVPAAASWPDLVFTANAAVVLDRTALLARFRHPQRRGEEPHFEHAFRGLQARGLIDAVRKLPAGLVLEGAGDCVFDAARDLFWLGHGPRSDRAAGAVVAELFGQDVVALELADPRFYHMDTALCPLSGGELLYLPGAFTRAGLAMIEERVVPQQRIAIDERDGSRLAANAVCIGDTVIMSGAGPRLRGELAERGYRVVATPLRSFLRSGGSAFCLTLRLDRCSASARPANQAAVA